MHTSPHIRFTPAAARWTEGFWADRFKLCHDSIMPCMREALARPDNSADLRNFRIAAGLTQGEHHGTNWSDGDCYKWMEAMSHVYGVTKDPELDRELDELIEVIAAAQDDKGYICTQVQLTDREPWTLRFNHELYNFGHLFTSACVHHQVTGNAPTVTRTRTAPRCATRRRPSDMP